MNKFENIQGTGFESVKPTFDVQKVYVKQKQSDYLKLSMNSVVYLIDGVKHLTAKQDKIDSEIVYVMSKLYTFGLLKNTNSETTLEVTRQDVRLMKQFLEEVMSVEEKLRDNRSEEFDADHYITMKFLLIELREWLLGEEIPFKEFMNSKKEEVTAEPSNNW